MLYMANPNGDTDLFSNYRPVSNISFVSKVLEKVVLNQLNSYLWRNDLLNADQSGYRAGHRGKSYDSYLKNGNSILLGGKRRYLATYNFLKLLTCQSGTGITASGHNKLAQFSSLSQLVIHTLVIVHS
eukprot:sb/3475341/